MPESAVPSITRITVLRHGETAWNALTRIQGHLDIGLNETGLWQAQQAGQALAGEDVHAVISSDLSRAYATARAVARHHDLTVQSRQDLRERGFGQFEGMTYAEIEAQMPQQAMLWRKRDPHFAPDGGESLLAFRDRIARAMMQLAQQHAGQHVVVVAHGGVLDIIYRMATGLDLQAARTWALANASINRVLFNGEHFSLVGWDDTRHLSGSLDEQHA
jgi:2,3-bisphosphoglycerate-dependent phosphoglycerate mutase